MTESALDQSAAFARPSRNLRLTLRHALFPSRLCPPAASAAVQTVAHAVAFAPVESAVAGLVLGAATTFKLATTGRILGISGAVKGLVRGDMRQASPSVAPPSSRFHAPSSAHHTYIKFR